MKSFILSIALGGLLLSGAQAYSEDKPFKHNQNDRVERQQARGDKFDRHQGRTEHFERRDNRRFEPPGAGINHRTRHFDEHPRDGKRAWRNRDNVSDGDRYGRRYQRDDRRFNDYRVPRRHVAVRRHHHYSPRTSDFLLGGLLLGSLAYQLSFDHAGPDFDFWRDFDGNCYRVEYRRHGRVYVDVPRRFCSRW